MSHAVRSYPSSSALIISNKGANNYDSNGPYYPPIRFQSHYPDRRFNKQFGSGYNRDDHSGKYGEREEEDQLAIYNSIPTVDSILPKINGDLLTRSNSKGHKKISSIRESENIKVFDNEVIPTSYYSDYDILPPVALPLAGVEHNELFPCEKMDLVKIGDRNIVFISGTWKFAASVVNCGQRHDMFNGDYVWVLLDVDVPVQKEINSFERKSAKKRKYNNLLYPTEATDHEYVLHKRYRKEDYWSHYKTSTHILQERNTQNHITENKFSPFPPGILNLRLRSFRKRKFPDDVKKFFSDTINVISELIRIDQYIEIEIKLQEEKQKAIEENIKNEIQVTKESDAEDETLEVDYNTNINAESDHSKKEESEKTANAEVVFTESINEAVESWNEQDANEVANAEYVELLENVTEASEDFRAGIESVLDELEIETKEYEDNVLIVTEAEMSTVTEANIDVVTVEQFENSSINLEANSAETKEIVNQGGENILLTPESDESLPEETVLVNSSKSAINESYTSTEHSSVVDSIVHPPNAKSTSMSSLFLHSHRRRPLFRRIRNSKKHHGLLNHQDFLKDSNIFDMSSSPIRIEQQSVCEVPSNHPHYRHSSHHQHQHNQHLKRKRLSIQ